jgi:hypothetical protein
VWHFNKIVNFIVFLLIILSHISSKNYEKVIDGIFHKYGCSYFNRIFIIKLSWNIPWYISDGICDRRFCWQIRIPCSHWRKMNRKVSKLICCPNNALFYLFLYIYIYIYILRLYINRKNLCVFFLKYIGHNSVFFFRTVLFFFFHLCYFFQNW